MDNYYAVIAQIRNFVYARGSVFERNEEEIIKFFRELGLWRSLYWQFATLVGVLFMTVVFSGNAFAATKTWVGGGSDNNWSTSANWLGGAVPADGDNVDIDSSQAGAGFITSIDIDGLKVGRVILSGSEPISLKVTSSVTFGGDVISGIDSTSGASKIIMSAPSSLGADVSLVNIGVQNTQSSRLNLNSHQVTFISDGMFSMSTIDMPILEGSGKLILRVDPEITAYFGAGSTYTGETRIISGGASSRSGVDSSSAYGSSSVYVGPMASISLNTVGSPWNFANPLELDSMGSGSGDLKTNFYIVASENNQSINFSSLAILGDTKVSLDKSGLDGIAINLGGVNANGHCMEYGNDNIDLAVYTGGPSNCVVATTSGSTNSNNTSTNSTTNGSDPKNQSTAEQPTPDAPNTSVKDNWHGAALIILFVASILGLGLFSKIQSLNKRI